MVWIIIGVLAASLVIYLISLYNQLIQIFVTVDKSWSNIMVLEKQRYDEIPKLVDVCNGYMKYEQETLQKVTLARTKFLDSKTPGQVAQAGADLGTALKSLFAVSENYPDLKANQTFLQLQQRVSYLENQIRDRREFYNDSVAIFNSRIQQIPYVFIANFLNYQQREMYQVSEAERNPQPLNFNVPK